MLVAQALGEYAGGALIGQAVETAQRAVSEVRHLEPTTWAMILFGAFAVWFVLSRFR
jgi:hypothetical protein